MSIARRALRNVFEPTGPVLVSTVEPLVEFSNGILFHFFPVTVAENSWKNQLSGNFVFSSWKMGVESRGTRRDPEGVEMGCTPA